MALLEFTAKTGGRCLIDTDCITMVCDVGKQHAYTQGTYETGATSLNRTEHPVPITAIQLKGGGGTEDEPNTAYVQAPYEEVVEKWKWARHNEG